MLFHLAHPLTLLGIVLALLVGVTAHNLAQVGAALALGDRTPVQQRFLTLRPTRQFSIYGLIPMLLVSGGWGFAEPVPMTARYWSRRGRVALALAAGPLTYLALCLLALLGLKLSLSSISQAEVWAAAAGTLAGVFVLSLLPVPPLDGGRILFTLVSPTRGWQQARYQLEERNFGLAIALAVVLLPQLFPGLPSIVGQLVTPLVRGLGHLVGLPG
ncbi:MAG: zinc metalloprotease [Mycobacteriales bacterium]